MDMDMSITESENEQRENIKKVNILIAECMLFNAPMFSGSLGKSLKIMHNPHEESHQDLKLDYFGSKNKKITNKDHEFYKGQVELYAANRDLQTYCNDILEKAMNGSYVPDELNYKILIENQQKIENYSNDFTFDM